MQLQGVQLAANEHKLVLGCRFPGFGGNTASLATELKDVTFRFSLEPKNTFSPKHGSGQLGHQEMLELGQIEGAIALEGHRNKSILGQVG